MGISSACRTIAVGALRVVWNRNLEGLAWNVVLTEKTDFGVGACRPIPTCVDMVTGTGWAMDDGTTPSSPGNGVVL